MLPEIHTSDNLIIDKVLSLGFAIRWSNDQWCDDPEM